MGYSKGDKTIEVKVSLTGDISSDLTDITYTQNLRVWEEYSVFNKRKRLVDGDWINLITGSNSIITNAEMRTKDDDLMYGNLLVIIKNLSQTNPKSPDETLDSSFNVRYPYVYLYSVVTNDGRAVNGSANALSGGGYGIVGQVEPGNSLVTHLRATNSAFIKPMFATSSPLSYVDVEYSVIWVGR
jgi:hypothetical protein